MAQKKPWHQNYVLVAGLGAGVIIIVLAMTKGDSGFDWKQFHPREQKPAPVVAPPPPQTAPSTDWNALAQKIDMMPWKRIEATMLQAATIRDEAWKKRNAGDLAGWKTDCTEALAKFRVVEAEFEKFRKSVDDVKPGLWDKSFMDREKKMARWTREFRDVLATDDKK